MSTLELIAYCVVMIVGIVSSVFLASSGVASWAAPAAFSTAFTIIMNIANSARE